MKLDRPPNLSCQSLFNLGISLRLLLFDFSNSSANLSCQSLFNFGISLRLLLFYFSNSTAFKVNSSDIRTYWTFFFLRRRLFLGASDLEEAFEPFFVYVFFAEIIAWRYDIFPLFLDQNDLRCESHGFPAIFLYYKAIEKQSIEHCVTHNE